MAKDRVPAFQFYPKDFLTDERVVLMSNTEIGIYMRLICFCWLEGTLPLETDSLARMARMPVNQFTRLWEKSPLRSCFQVNDDGRLHHKRLDEERDKQETFRRRQSDNGKRGGRPEKGLGFSGLSDTKAKKSSPISDLRSPDSSRRTPPPRTSAVGPLPEFPRLRLFGWMAQRLNASLGDAEFDLEGWLQRLEADSKLVIPTDDKERWKWLQLAFDHELRTRGLLKPAESDEAKLQALTAKGPSVRPYQVAK